MLLDEIGIRGLLIALTSMLSIAGIISFVILGIQKRLGNNYNQKKFKILLGVIVIIQVILFALDIPGIEWGGMFRG